MVVKIMKKNTKKLRDISGDIINNESLENVEKEIKKETIYGLEDEMITQCFKKFPNNSDRNLVAMKIGLIDITNSTNLSLFKSKISIDGLSKIITSITDIDKKIADGDTAIVNKIAKSNGKINLFSFATKYCCYHNICIYERDDYSIFDSVLAKYLPQYFDDITENQIQKWRKSFDYKSYNDYITNKLDELNITVENRKRKFDHFVWYKNRQRS